MSNSVMFYICRKTVAYIYFLTFKKTFFIAQVATDNVLKYPVLG